MKVYPADQQKVYRKEKEIYKKIVKQTNHLNTLKGFPKIVSTKEGKESAEILMQSLGPNLKILRNQCSVNQAFSDITVYQIIVQLVSTYAMEVQLAP